MLSNSNPKNLYSFLSGSSQQPPNNQTGNDDTVVLNGHISGALAAFSEITRTRRSELFGTMRRCHPEYIGITKEFVEVLRKSEEDNWILGPEHCCFFFAVTSC